MKQDEDRKYNLTLTMRNRPGVLVRCAQIFGRRGHNIEALHVTSASGQKDVSIMTITAFGKATMTDQVMAQLAKLIDVIDIVKQEGEHTS